MIFILLILSIHVFLLRVKRLNSSPGLPKLTSSPTSTPVAFRLVSVLHHQAGRGIPLCPSNGQ